MTVLCPARGSTSLKDPNRNKRAGDGKILFRNSEFKDKNVRRILGLDHNKIKDSEQLMHVFYTYYFNVLVIEANANNNLQAETIMTFSFSNGKNPSFMCNFRSVLMRTLTINKKTM